MNTMEHDNSRIEILLGVIRNLLDDIVDLIEGSKTLRVNKELNIRRETARDFKYLSSRTRKEGFPFLSVTLPRLGKWYTEVLTEEWGMLPVGFKPYVTEKPIEPSDRIMLTLHKQTYPLFCRVLMRVILDEGGSVSERAAIVRAYRTLFYLFYKMEMPLTEEQLACALKKWYVIEDEIREFSYPGYYDSDIVMARSLIASIISHDEWLFTRITPQHGPGAVAGGESNEEKWETSHYIPSLHCVYPRFKYTWPLHKLGYLTTSTFELYKTLYSASTVKDAVSRLLFVPKDSRGPRVISCEPKELMFIQQGVMQNLTVRFHSATRGRINFIDQSINANLARASSLTPSIGATVDLEDASDRVSWLLVKLVFPDWTHKYLSATRSHSTLMPDGSVVKHEKYAPMGSALCFPIESVIFWAFAVVSAVNSGMSVDSAMADTYVYGDDLIVPPGAFDHLVRCFTRVGLKVNTGKSFVSGPFRESCGVDAWKGFDVTPLKIKKDICRRSFDGPLADAVCKYSSHCFALNYRRTGEYLLQLVEKHFPGVIRVPVNPIGCLHVVDPLAWEMPKGIVSRYDLQTCCVKIRGWVVSKPSTHSKLDGLNRLLKYLHGNWEEHDPGKVVASRSTKTRKRDIRVEGWPWLSDVTVNG